jgi:hypothetical protein
MLEKALVAAVKNPHGTDGGRRGKNFRNRVFCPRQTFHSLQIDASQRGNVDVVKDNHVFGPET